MGGGHHGEPFKTHGPFVPLKVRGVLSTKIAMAGVWLFLMYRMKVDGGHHFVRHLFFARSEVNVRSQLHQHPWEEPKMIAYLEKIDKKYGTSYSTDNMHHH